MAKKKKQKFSEQWRSATDLGREFGLSAIALNKRLAAAGHRDELLKTPTPTALEQGWAISTPLRDGLPHFMWNRSKVSELLAGTAKKLSASELRFETFLRDVTRLERQAREHGSDKMLDFYVTSERSTLAGVSEADVTSVCKRLGESARLPEFLELLRQR